MMKIWGLFFSCFPLCVCNIIIYKRNVKLSKLVYIGLRDVLRIIRTETLVIQSCKIMKKTKQIQEPVHSLKEVQVKRECSDLCETNEEDGLQITRIIKDYEENWSNLQVSNNDLQLKYCFLIGQEFCYKEIMENMYIGLVKNSVFLFKQTQDTILYQCLYDSEMRYNEIGKDFCLQYNGTNRCDKLKDSYKKELYEFFNLHFPLHEHIEIWKKKDKRMKKIADTIKGQRLLKLDPRESFFSFICSSNNNIPRITLMNECLRKRYGTHIATIIFKEGDIFVKTKGNFDTMQKSTSSYDIRVKKEKKEDNDPLYKNKTYAIPSIKNESNEVQIKREKEDNIHKIKRRAPQKGTISKKMKIEVINKENEMDLSSTDEQVFYQLIKKERKTETDTKIYSFYEFPTVETLSKLEEKNLRDMGFGYRSTFIISSAKMLKSCGADKWLEELKKEKKTSDCIKKLLQFPGVGLKVANCICLFGLHRYDCIPIDTHIYDIIYKYYKYMIDNLETNTPRKKKNSKKNVDNHVENIKKETSARGKKTSVDNDITKSKKHTVSLKKTLLNKEKKKALTHNVYAKLFKQMRHIFGPNCGWAQTMLFTAELKNFNGTFT